MRGRRRRRPVDIFVGFSHISRGSPACLLQPCKRPGQLIVWMQRSTSLQRLVIQRGTVGACGRWQVQFSEQRRSCSCSCCTNCTLQKTNQSLVTCSQWVQPLQALVVQFWCSSGVVLVQFWELRSRCEKSPQSLSVTQEAVSTCHRARISCRISIGDSPIRFRIMIIMHFVCLSFIYTEVVDI